MSDQPSLRAVPSEAPCPCEAQHRPGLLNLNFCTCECHQAGALTYASLKRTIHKIAGTRHLS